MKQAIMSFLAFALVLCLLASCGAEVVPESSESSSAEALHEEASAAASSGSEESKTASEAENSTVSEAEENSEVLDFSAEFSTDHGASVSAESGEISEPGESKTTLDHVLTLALDNDGLLGYSVDLHPDRYGAYLLGIGAKLAAAENGHLYTIPYLAKNAKICDLTEGRVLAVLDEADYEGRANVWNAMIDGNTLYLVLSDRSIVTCDLHSGEVRDDNTKIKALFAGNHWDGIPYLVRGMGKVLIQTDNGYYTLDGERTDAENVLAVERGEKETTVSYGDVTIERPTHEEPSEFFVSACGQMIETWGSVQREGESVKRESFIAVFEKDGTLRSFARKSTSIDWSKTTDCRIEILDHMIDKVHTCEYVSIGDKTFRDVVVSQEIFDPNGTVYEVLTFIDRVEVYRINADDRPM